jgi:hypothetical protein
MCCGLKMCEEDRKKERKKQKATWIDKAVTA